MPLSTTGTYLAGGDRVCAAPTNELESSTYDFVFVVGRNSASILKMSILLGKDDWPGTC